MKPLPFRSWKKKYKQLNVKDLTGNYFISSNWESIIKILKIINIKMPHIKNVIIDKVIVVDVKFR